MKRIESELTNVPRLTREQKASAKDLSDVELRFLVENYYESQDARKR
jgi:hypothetical protein